MSPRLTASNELRAFLYEHAGDTDFDTDVCWYARSAALVGELVGLLAAYQVRGTLTDAAGVTAEVVRQVGPSTLRAWWRQHRARLHREHVDAVRAALSSSGCGVLPEDGG